jgi:hypothetical protein
MDPITKNLLKPKLLILSLAVSLIPAAASHYPASAARAAAGGAGIVDALPILAATSVCAALVCIFLLSLLFETAKGAAMPPLPARGLGRTFGGLILLAFILAAFLVFVSMIFGLLSLPIRIFAVSALSSAEARGLIDLAASVLPILIAPVPLCVLCAYGLGRGNVREGIAGGLKELKYAYPRTLAVCAALFAAGRLAALPFAYIADTPTARIAETAVQAIVGAAGVLLLLALYIRRAGRRAAADPARKEAGT